MDGSDIVWTKDNEPVIFPIYFVHKLLRNMGSKIVFCDGRALLIFVLLVLLSAHTQE